jgi:hypothetical protein
MYLTETSAYNNAWQYSIAVMLGNVVRTEVMLMAKAEAKKEGGGPLTGKGPASMSFWQWVKLGQMGLDTWAKIHNIVMTLKSGKLEIDLYKLMPKLGAYNKADPSQPVIMLSLVPKDKSTFALMKGIADFNDPRFYLGNKIQIGTVKDYVPSLGVDGMVQNWLSLVSEMDGNDEMQRAYNAMTALMFNFNQVMRSMSVMKNWLAGASKDREQATMNRMSPRSINQTLQELTGARNSYWENMAKELKHGLMLISPDLAEYGDSSVAASKAAAQAVEKMMEAMADRRTVGITAAKQVYAAILNITVPLSVPEYYKNVDKVNDIIRKHMSEESSRLTTGDEKTHDTAINIADAWINKFIRDELRAIRQIYALSAKRQERELLGPKLAGIQGELDAGAAELKRLERKVAELEIGLAGGNELFGKKRFQDMNKELLDRVGIDQRQ